MEVLVTQSCLCLYFTKLTYRSRTPCKLHPAPGPYLPGVTTPVAFCISERSQDNKPGRGGLRCVQSGLTLWCHMDCSPLGSSVQGILQERILEWVAVPFSKGSSPPRGQIRKGEDLATGRPALIFWNNARRGMQDSYDFVPYHIPQTVSPIYMTLSNPPQKGAQFLSH